MKKIIVIGTGRMDGAFATAFAKRTSHAVSIRGSHAGSSSAAALSRQLDVRLADDKELLAADVVFVATPPAASPPENRYCRDREAPLARRSVL